MPACSAVELSSPLGRVRHLLPRPRAGLRLLRVLFFPLPSLPSHAATAPVGAHICAFDLKSFYKLINKEDSPARFDMPARMPQLFLCRLLSSLFSPNRRPPVSSFPACTRVRLLAILRLCGDMTPARSTVEPSSCLSLHASGLPPSPHLLTATAPPPPSAPPLGDVPPFTSPGALPDIFDCHSLPPLPHVGALSTAMFVSRALRPPLSSPLGRLGTLFSAGDALCAPSSFPHLPTLFLLSRATYTAHRCVHFRPQICFSVSFPVGAHPRFSFPSFICTRIRMLACSVVEPSLPPLTSRSWRHILLCRRHALRAVFLPSPPYLFTWSTFGPGLPLRSDTLPRTFVSPFPASLASARISSSSQAPDPCVSLGDIRKAAVVSLTHKAARTHVWTPLPYYLSKLSPSPRRATSVANLGLLLRRRRRPPPSLRNRRCTAVSGRDPCLPTAPTAPPHPHCERADLVLIADRSAFAAPQDGADCERDRAQRASARTSLPSSSGPQLIPWLRTKSWNAVRLCPLLSSYVLTSSPPVYRLTLPLTRLDARSDFGRQLLPRP
ncbi:hypothetical protein DFH07DRAFT_968943 [Mycena maculata]|uniref:Uncharacterized protein n=1 Tax=Mycena maculata TaxID=230809 RepID=A0AAD7HZ39_9AGAR|nr:hypothetical protein DFH07DRAFT_968943 [Mycena maculata]